MSWSQREFDCDEGVLLFLRRLAASPLVRRSLPNAAATMNEYFNFKRRAGESISSFLVREGLGFEEFQEALLQLKEERDGVDPASRDFDLPDLSPSAGSRSSQGDQMAWRGWQRAAPEDWADNGDDEEAFTAVDGEQVPQPSPKRAATHPSPKRSPGRREPGDDPPPGFEDQDPRGSLGPMDTFILDVLRGWRLLVAASLSQDEWRDVLATTGNKLDYLNIADALQTLWDEQLSASRASFPGGGPAQFSSYVMESSPHWNQFAAWHEDEWYDDWNTGNWNDASWHESHDNWYDGSSPPEDGVVATAVTEEERNDPDLIEAVEAEKAAESLALESQRTWKQAQKATATLRRDRGFGQAAFSANKGSSVGPCYICGGSHYARDCAHPQYRKGFGKHLNPAELDQFLMKGKGKGKGIGKYPGKYQHMVSWDDPGSSSFPYDVQAFVKGKSSAKGFQKGKFKQPLNAYGLDLGFLDFGALEIFPLELFSASQSRPPTSRSIPVGFGMLDCGATASAGPEASLKLLISKMREKESQLLVMLDTDQRPYFRYGSGKWGQALYRARISTPKRPNHTVEIFALPNPPEYYEEWFHDDMLVPILIGMDHLTKTGLILDFSDGHAIHGADPQSTPYMMDKNAKGHFMVNLMDYMFGSVTEAEITPTAPEQQSKARSKRPSSGEVESQWLELGMLQCDIMNTSSDRPEVPVTPPSRSFARDAFDYLVQRRRSLHSQSPPESDPCLVSSNGPEEVHSVTTTGSREMFGTQSTRSPIFDRVLALQGKTRSLQCRFKRLWGLEGVPDLCSQDRVCPSSRLSRQSQDARSSTDRDTGLDSTREGLEGSPSRCRSGQADTEDDRKGGTSHLTEGSNGSPSGRDQQHEQQLSPGCPDRKVRFVTPRDAESSERSLFTGVVTDRRGGGGIETFEGNPSRAHITGSGGPGSGIGAGSSQLSGAADNTSPMKFPSSCMAMTSDDDVTKKGDLSGDYENSFTCEDSQLAEFELDHLVDKCRSKTTRKSSISQLKPFSACERAHSREEVSYQSKEIKPTCSKSSSSLESPMCLSTSTSHSLPWKIAQALVTMASMMMTSCQSDLKTLLRGPQGVDVWEMFCAPESWLTTACQESGLTCSRINLHMGYDLYDPKTYDRLRSKFAIEKPRKVWVSTRCTFWCPWTSLNYQTVEQKAELEKFRRRERRLFRLLIPFLIEMITEYPETELFWEWPTRCYGWKEPWLQRLAAAIKSLDRDWHFARIDGCRYGLQSRQGLPLKKCWTIATSSHHFFVIYRKKTCTGQHEHDHIQGIETARSAYYPWKMCKSIAQFWAGELCPVRWLQHLHSDISTSMTSIEQCHQLQLMNQLDVFPQEEVKAKQDIVPTDQELAQWKIQLLKYHRASGHPNNYNLARIIREAGKPRWQVQAAFELHCDECKAMKQGGESSGKIPPATLRPLPKAWEVVGMDTFEWIPHNANQKLKVLLLIDLATKFKVTTCLHKCPLYEMKMETTAQLLEAFTKLWLADKPKPICLVPDNARSMISQQMRTVMSDLNISVEPPPAKESWAHGLVERAVQEVKDVSSKISMDQPSLSPETVLALTTHALNSTEFVQGFTPFQWVYGRQFSLSEEDERTMALISPDVPSNEFLDLMTRRTMAEDVARRQRALRTLSKLHNSRVRQPLQVFQPMDLVKIWRKYTTDGGTRGGLRRTGKNQWLGPGRVVFHEIIRDQVPGDPRRHIVWVIVAGNMHRCSVHSVRKATEREKLEYELHHPEDPSQWQSLKDMLPSRSYVDITNEEPGEEESELPSLPEQPDKTTVAFVPLHRHRVKSGPSAREMPGIPEHEPLQNADPSLLQQSSPVTPLNDYSPSDVPVPTDGEDEGEETGNAGVGSGLPSRLSNASSSSSRAPLLTDGAGVIDESEPSEPDQKRLKVENEVSFLECMETVSEGYLLFIDLELSSLQEKNKFIRSPSLFLAQKLRDCEVRFEKLRPEHRKLFVRAKAKEVNSFISNEAVRRCLSWEEEQEAKNSGRLMRCRWVLTWKPTPEESLEESLEEIQQKPESTTFTSDGKKKAKARIVLLGFEHPDLLSDQHKTSSPVQAVLTRNVSYQLVMQMGWSIQGMDMSTAFLQTLPTEEEKRLWPHGVKELREALQVPEGGVLRILKNFYGSTSAPRNLWQNVDRALKGLGAVKIKGDPCFWLWLEDRVDPQSGRASPYPLGFMSGHVDDFHRAGQSDNPKWNAICKKIDELYKWGSVKHNSYRHAGTDLQIVQDPQFGRCLVVDQSYYVETLQDVDIDPKRFSEGESLMNAKEVGACRSSLGTLQWLAVQTQPLICGRCNLLLTELTTHPKMTIAQEIQEMIRELRKRNTVLKFFKLPGVQKWNDLVVVGLGDQAHGNRPKGGSTGGMLIFLGGPSIARGVASPLILIAWKTWKLQRVAISTNDAEVQALVDTEDAVFRTRLLWAEMHGCGTLNPSRDILSASIEELKQVPGILGTDSRGGYDSIMINESPLLGLSNMRAAIQAYQLKEAIPTCNTTLLWLAGDWNLSDALTKKKPDSRESLEYYFQKRCWMLKFDPEFIVSARKLKATQGKPIDQMRAKDMNSEKFWAHAVCHF